MERLRPQLVDGVSVLCLSDAGERSIGAKRQIMVEQATADYVCFFDDDDLPSLDYVARVMSFIDGDNPPDVVGFRLKYFSDGVQQAVAVHSYRAAEIAVPNMQRGWRKYDRLPNHLNPVRRELALKVGYKDLNFGEDGDYARRLAKLSPREAFIDANLYEYWFRTKRPGERTNADRVGRR